MTLISIFTRMTQNSLLRNITRFLHVCQQGTKWANKTIVFSTKNTYFGVKLAIFGPKFLIFWEGLKVLVPIFQKTTLTPRSYCFWSEMAPNGPERPVFGLKWPIMPTICQGNPIFVNRAFVALCVTTIIVRIGPITLYPFVSMWAWRFVFFWKSLFCHTVGLCLSSAWAG